MRAPPDQQVAQARRGRRQIQLHGVRKDAGDARRDRGGGGSQQLGPAMVPGAAEGPHGAVVELDGVGLQILLRIPQGEAPGRRIIQVEGLAPADFLEDFARPEVVTGLVGVDVREVDRLHRVLFPGWGYIVF